MSNIELKSVQLENGETLGYREREGGEQVLLLIHGNMTSSKHWDLVLENINDRFKVYAVDLRGFGISSFNERIDSLKDFSEDVKLFVDQLGLKKFSVAGWSTGGGVAMQFAADYPDYVEKIVLLASVSTRGYPFHGIDATGQVGARYKTKEEIAVDPMRTIPINSAYENKDKDFLRNLWNAVIYTHNQPAADHYDEYIDDMITQRNLTDVYHALNTFNISSVTNELGEGTGEASKIQAPTLILWGKNDLVVPANMAIEIKEDLGDNAELVYLENCGHSPLVDDLDQLLEKIESFL